MDFENATWTVPKVRMKGRKPHVVYLSRQAMDIFVALHTRVAGSRFVLPLEPLTVHDLRRTASTLPNEVGFNGDWIEKCLALEEGSRTSRSVYNKAEYAGPRRHMLQEWADMVEAWIDGRTHMPKLVPEDVIVPVLIPTV